MRHPRWRLLRLLSVVLVVASCVSIGKEFPTPGPGTIMNGVTTRAELLQLFGPPTQVGIEDGDQTWAWIHVRAGAGQTLSKQLYVRFGERGVVKSYSYTSDVPEEIQKRTK